ncbi:TIGR04168 family protein [Okeania sp.]|uniref:TIGR04168 family protein n=1 Tax=Okeania sp. TaxID=3100323 RepID=UPI002B4B025A|nr:TIGR04168 family protein [Okeania sp.]MEB3339740.1 TIGR04168 family protein [Okeania sp.]
MTNNQNKLIKIAVIGDVHNKWELEDEIALKHLEIDLVLFVGDFGNEAVEVVRAIAAVDIPKAAVFGNHDAWYTATEWGRKKCPYDQTTEDRVQQQIDLFGEAHVGYSSLDFPELALTVVGTRPFTWGGPEWRYADFYRERFGVNNFEESTNLIVKAVQNGKYENVIFLGHNGPTGLGDAPEDPVGKDWQPIGGDFGDPDFTNAITQSRKLGKKISLVTFGHMHHNLRHTKERLRKCVDMDSEGTLYFNAARVPRIIETENQKKRNFSIVSMQGGFISQVALVWVDQDLQIISEELLYSQKKLAVESI